ncbi:uncharacterized protein LOC129602822 isoform X2 [Paramacrobiotus metropolitanus]|nr:uncharacterized protein LOC129602822 isoform X2 [Paramacrobiotus metropolitanus]
MPVNVKGMMIPDVAKSLGRWYEYKFHTPGTPSFNCINEYIPVGLVPVYGSQKWGIAVSWTISLQVQLYPDPLCVGLFTQSTYTVDGQRNGSSWFPQTTSGVPTLYTTLFTDFKTVEISYRCNSPPEKNKNGMCNEPYFWVNTRTKPANLKSSDISYIEKKVEDVLRPFCFGLKDLNQTIWDPSFPRCQPKPPQSFIDSIRSLRTAVLRYPTEMSNS